MVRTRRMAAMTGDENVNPNSTEPQPMEIDQKPVKTRKATVKSKNAQATKQAAEPSTSVVREEDEEQVGANAQVEPQPEIQVQPVAQPLPPQKRSTRQSYELPNSGGMRVWGEPPGGWADDQPETGTSNTSTAPDNEGQDVVASNQQDTSNKAKSSAKRSQPKATKDQSKPIPKSESDTMASDVIENPWLDEPEEELDYDMPYTPKDLRKELRENLNTAGCLHPETWHPSVKSPFDAPPPPPENPPPPGSVLTVGLADKEVFRLYQLLRFWVSQEKVSRTANKFFHRLGYTYSRADSLREVLARRDRVLALTLERLSQRVPFELFLCRLARGFEDVDSDPQQVSPCYIIENLLDMQGRSYVKSVPVDENDWTQKPIEQQKPKLLPGYFDAAFVLVPRDTVADFLWETIEANGPPTTKYNATEKPVQTLLENYQTLSLRSAEDRERYWPIFSSLLRRACTWDSEKKLGFMPGQFVEDLLKACISAKDWELFTFAAGFTGFSLRKLPYDPLPFVRWARTEIAEGRATFQDIQQGILAVSLSHSLVKQRCSSITAFYQTTDEIVPRDWAQKAIAHIADFPDSQVIGQQDGSELFSAIKTCFGMGGKFIELATNVIKRNSSKLSFLLGFANELHESMISSTEDAIRELYLNLAEQVVNEMRPYKINSRSAETARLREIVQIRSTYRKVEQDLKLLKPAMEAADKADISRFISGLIAEKADTLLMRLTMRLVGDAKRIPLRELTHLWVPFLTLLLEVLEKHQLPLSTPRYQNIFAAILEMYLLKKVGKAPKPSWQPAMRKISCGCGLCVRVNQFLSESCSFDAIRISGVSIAFDHVNRYLMGVRESISCDFTPDAASGTVTVTKRLTPVATALKEWETKKEQVKKDIFAKFDQAKLRVILGADYPWLIGFKLLEDVVEVEVHDEKELPPLPALAAPVIGKPVDSFIIGRPDLSNPSSRGHQPSAAHQNTRQPYHQPTTLGYQGPQPGQALAQPVGAYYAINPPSQGERPPANPWAYAGPSTQPLPYGQQFQSGPPQTVQNAVSISVGSNGFAGSIQMTNNVNNQQSSTQINGLSGSISVVQDNGGQFNINLSNGHQYNNGNQYYGNQFNGYNHQATHTQSNLDRGRQLFFSEEAIVIQRQFPSWNSDSILAELRRRWTAMPIDLVESYVSKATMVQNQPQAHYRPSLPAPVLAAPQHAGPGLTPDDDLKAGREYYISTQMGSLRAQYPTHSHQLLLNTVLPAWNALPRSHREWFNKQALTQKQQQPQLAPIATSGARGLSRNQSIPSLSSIAPPPPPSAATTMPLNFFEGRLAVMREEARVKPTTAFAIAKPSVDRNGMVIVRMSSTTQVSIPEQDYMESKARLAPYPDVAHLDPCRKELERGRTWWINRFKDDFLRLNYIPGKSEQQIKQLLGEEWATSLTRADRLRTDDLGQIEDAKSGVARTHRVINESMMSRQAKKRARTSYGVSARWLESNETESEEENPVSWKPRGIKSTSMASKRPSATSATSATASSSVASPPVSGYEVFAKELEAKLRKSHPSASAENLRAVIQNRWESMSESHRAVYATMAIDKAKSGSGTVASSSYTSAAPSTNRASSTRKYDGFELYLNTDGFIVKRRYPEYSYAEVVEIMRKRWDAMLPSKRVELNTNASIYARDHARKSVFNALETLFKNEDKGKAKASSTPVAPNTSASTSGPSRPRQAEGFDFWFKFEEKRFKQKNPGLTHEQAVAALRKQWDDMSHVAQLMYKEMAAKANADTNNTSTPKPTASQTPSRSSSTPTIATASSSSTPNPSASGSITREEWERKYDGFNFYLNTEGRKLVEPPTTYDSIVYAMRGKWDGLSAKERASWEKLAKSWRSYEKSRKEGFNELRRALKMPLEPDIPPPPVTTTTTTAATATSATSSKASGGITWEEWAKKYDGLAWYINTEGYKYKQKHRDLFDYDTIVKIMEDQWKRMTTFEREDYESQAKKHRTSYGGRQMFSRLRRLCGLPEMADVIQPPKPLKNPPPLFKSTWRGSGSKTASSMLSSSPPRPEPATATSSPADSRGVLT
ncbi:hypothetical protein B0T20DRAFT_418463 [Sordaria brevicollis]|uniref:HMG box domain-containing protein n=1 Tax=Sordaria brevicollis TaxID=83679 RepID=A0AAE0P8S9_SORBR|nr:hypothetical protein B0T20DRAFT_418463 [Sordaria brevicollis]